MRRADPRSTVPAPLEAPTGRPAPTFFRAPRRLELADALGEAIQKQTWPWARDLLRPFVQRLVLGAPKPLEGLVDPQALAESNSRFIDVLYGSAAEGCYLRVHVTETLPPPESGFASRPRATLLLHHGFNGSTFSFRFISRLLAQEGYRVICMDRPPFGLTARPSTWPTGLPSPYANAGAARLALGLLDALSITEPVVAIGHSAGASICLEMRQQRPDRVRAIGLISPALPADTGRTLLNRQDLGGILRFAVVRVIMSSDELGTYYARDIIGRRTRELRGGKGDIGLFDPELLTDELTEGYLKPTLAKDWDLGTVRQFRSFTENGLGYDYDQLTLPMCIVQGRYDKVTSTDEVRRLVSRLAAREQVVSEGGARASVASFHASLMARLESARGEWRPSLLEWRPEGSARAWTVYYEIEGTAHLPLDEKPEATSLALELWLNDVLMSSGSEGARTVAAQDAVGRGDSTITDDESGGAEMREESLS